MGKYQRYSEYKDSGVEWIGEIPKHWDMWKIFHASPYIGSGTTPSTEDEFYYGGKNLWVTTSELRETTIINTNKKVTDQALQSIPSLQEHPKNSIAIAMYGATIGRLGIFGKKATTNQACCVIPPSKILHNKYLFYWLYAMRKEIINLSSGGGQPNINQEKIASLRVSTPCIIIQKVIANFLDHETTKMDALIEKQQQLIELLKEKRQAVISHTVTKGLHLDIPMRDSGIEWLGEVPEHWRLRKFNYCTSIRNGQVNPTKSPFAQMILYAPNHIEKSTGKILFKETAEEQGADSGKYFCLKEEVIYSKIRPALAKVAVCSEDKALCSADMYPINASNGLTNKFLFFYLLSSNFTVGTILDSDRVAMPKVNRETLGSYKIPLPPIEEQNQIVTKIENKLFCIDLVIEQANYLIKLLKERRTALISAAVTGKIDVRNWQPPTASKIKKESQ